MRGSVINFDGGTRTGLLEGPGQLRWRFSLYGSLVLLKPGDEVEFSGCIEGPVRRALDVRKVPRPGKEVHGGVFEH